MSVRKETLELEFTQLLNRLSARRAVVLLLGDVVRDAWKSRINRDRRQAAKVRRQIEALERQKQGLLEAHIYSRSIDQRTYADERSRLEGLIEIAEASQREPLANTLDLDTALAHTADLLTDLAGYWNRLNHDQKPGFLRAVFPAGLTYDSDRIETGESPCLLRDEPPRQ